MPRVQARARRAVFGLLVGAATLYLPVVYGIVARGGNGAPIALGFGLLSMGLAWGAGCSLEDRRRGTVRGLATVGALAPWITFAPLPSVSFPPLERGLMVLASLLAAAALVVLLRRRL